MAPLVCLSFATRRRSCPPFAIRELVAARTMLPNTVRVPEPAARLMTTMGCDSPPTSFQFSRCREMRERSCRLSAATFSE